MTDATRLIQYVCVSADHTGSGNGEPTITVHEGLWAFCTHTADAADHEWSRVDGRPLHELLRFPPRAPEAAS